MDMKIVTLAGRLDKEVDPRVGEYVLELGSKGKSFEGVVQKMREIITITDVLRAKDAAG